MTKHTDMSAERLMPSILDRELGDSSGDAFGHRHFAEVLRSLIEGDHKPPYSIGLLGSWGTGKSTIKELYLKALKTDMRGGKGARRADRVYPITFNAWRYGGEQDLKRALLRHAFIQLGGDDLALRRELYDQVSSVEQTRRGFWSWAKEASLQTSCPSYCFYSSCLPPREYLLCLPIFLASPMHGVQQ